jgi:hypothetical protein
VVPRLGRWSRSPRGWVDCGPRRRGRPPAARPRAWPASRRRRQGLGPGRPPSTCARDVHQVRPLDAHERVGGHPRLDIVPGAPPPRRSARPDSPRRGPQSPVCALERTAGAGQAVLPVRGSPRPSRWRDVQSGPARAGVTKAWRCRGTGWNLPGWTAGAGGGLVCPCVGGHPVLPPGNCDRFVAALSPSAKLLVGGYLNRLRQPDRRTPPPVAVTSASAIAVQRRWSTSICLSWSQGTPRWTNRVVTTPWVGPWPCKAGSASCRGARDRKGRPGGGLGWWGSA